MSKYELMFIIDRDVTEEAREALIEKFKKMAVDRGSEIIALEKMGMKKFAYPINYKNEGYYVLMTFETANNGLVSEMGNLMNITDGIVRQMFTKK